MQGFLYSAKRPSWERKPGKQIIKQGLFKSKGYRMFSKYKLEAEISKACRKICKTNACCDKK